MLGLACERLTKEMLPQKGILTTIHKLISIFLIHTWGNLSLSEARVRGEGSTTPGLLRNLRFLSFIALTKSMGVGSPPSWTRSSASSSRLAQWTPECRLDQDPSSEAVECENLTSAILL